MVVEDTYVSLFPLESTVLTTSARRSLSYGLIDTEKVTQTTTLVMTVPLPVNMGKPSLNNPIPQLSGERRNSRE